MEIVIRPFDRGDTDGVVALWTACGLVRPWNDPRRDIERKLTVQPELFLVAVQTPGTQTPGTQTPGTQIPGPQMPGPQTPGTQTAATGAPDSDGAPRLVGAGMAGFDGHRGWVNYLAVDPDLQGTGLGRRFMAEFERRLVDLGCPKVNLQVRAGNEQVLGFYESLGYAPDHAVSLGKRLIPDV